jgi:branched-chain amino acid transport system ATP-binding protein
VLEIAGLTRRFGGFTAVNTVSFSVRQGEIVGLIGPNGSGKTTTFNLIAGTLVPNAG